MEISDSCNSINSFQSRLINKESVNTFSPDQSNETSIPLWIEACDEEKNIVNNIETNSFLKCKVNYDNGKKI